MNMMWWKQNDEIPYTNREFMNIIKELVFECPSSEQKKTKNGTYPNGKRKYKIEYKKVSKRGQDFKSRGVVGNYLNTILAQIRRPLAKKGNFAVLESSGDVKAEFDRITNSSSLSDETFDVIVFKKHSNMTQTEAIYYYIRNAFAHGSFSVVGDVYFLESGKGADVKARIRLKESSIKDLIKLKNMEPSEIRKLQKIRTK